MMNPILERELKARMRTWKTPIMLMIYLLFIGIFVALFFIINEENSRYGYGGGSFNPSTAINIYNLILIGQFVILMIVLPIFTATSISGERERQTLDLMLCTDISPWKIIFGKIASALSFVFLLIIAAMPFMSIVFLFGGITLFDILKVIFFYMITAILVSSIGLYCSTRFKRVVTSIIASYFIMALLFVGTLIAYGVFIMIVQLRGNYQFIDKYGYEILLGFLGINPGLGIFSFYYGDALGFTRWFNVSTTIFKDIKPWMVSVAFDTIMSTLLIIITRFRLMKIK